MSVKQWDKTLQPREKAFAQGIHSLNDAELLALILRNGTKGNSSVSLSLEILKCTGGINGLMKLSLNELMRLPGIGKAKACELLATLEIVNRINYQTILDKDVIREPENIIAWLQSSIGMRSQEYFIVIYLNNHNQVLGYEELFKGDDDEVQFSSKQIFAHAMQWQASGIILAHNHPSQFVHPSLADNMATERLKKAGELLSIPVLDHLIISHDNYYSYRQNQIL